MRELERKVAIVTGGGSGIGRAIALRFALGGAGGGVVDVAEPAAEQTVREIAACSGGGEGGESVAVLCDVSRQADVAAAFEKLRRRYGTLDVLVNSAGIAHVGNLEQTSEQDLDLAHSVAAK